MKYFLYTFLFITSSAFAKNDVIKSALHGTVVDATTNKNLEGATINIHDVKIIVATNKNGFFKTPELNNGTYLVEISFVGYSSIIENINISGKTERIFKLKPSTSEQEEVIVTGVSTATKIRYNPQPITVVNKNDLNKTTSTNLIDALAKVVPGVSTYTTGPAISKPVIRGLGFNRLVTIHDGVRQEGQQWGEEHGIEVDESSIQRVEVLKGAASLMYGSDAMAGVLNLMGYQPVQQQTAKANIGLGFIDNNGMLNTHANYAAHYKNGFNFNVYGSYKNAKDYKNKYDDIVLNSRFLEYNFGAGLGLQKQWGYTQVLVSSFNQKIGIVDGERDSATGKFILYSGEPQQRIATNDDLNSRDYTVPFQKITHIKVTSNSSFILEKGRLNTTISYQKNTREEFGHLPVSDHADLHFDLKTIAYNFQYHINEKNGFKNSFGINGMQQSNHNHLDGGHELLIPDYTLFDFGVFAITRKSFKKGIFTAGIRFDNRNLKTDELLDGTEIKFAKLDKTFQNISGSIGLSYLVNDKTTIKFNVARGFRSPTVTELSSNGAHEGTFRYELGDNNLTAENSLQFDAGFEWQHENISVNANLFYNRINNYIYSSKLSNVNGDDSLRGHNGNFETVFKFQQADAHLYGFEANVDIHPIHYLHFKNSFSYVKGNFINAVAGNTNLPFMPQPRLLSELRFDFNKIKRTFSNAFLKLELDNYFEQNNIFSAYNTETITNGFSLLNFGFGADIVNKNKQQIVQFFINANNLFDIAYQNHLSRLKYTDTNKITNRMGVFNMGRNYSLKVIIPFSFKLR